MRGALGSGHLLATEVSAGARGLRIARRSGLLALAIVVALGLAEVALRQLMPSALFLAGRDTEGWTENTPTFDIFMRTDAALGYVPRPDTLFYDARGLCRDQPPDEALPSGAAKVLWIGDSVTARRRIEREVRRQSAVPFTSWCGGVEGYNAEQSRGYFERVLRPLHPDLVLFTLHHNDWWNTPVVFYDDSGRVHCRTLDHDVRGFSPWWFRHSYLYRLAFSRLAVASGEYTGAAADARVEAALRGMRDMVAADGIKFAVLLLPPMLAEDRWGEADRQRHASALALLSRLGIRHVDLLPGLRRALGSGVDPQQLPGDWMHPSETVARFLAEEVVRAGILPGG